MVQSIFLRVSAAFRTPFWICDTPVPMLIFVDTRQVDELTIKDPNERGLGHLHSQGCMRVRHRFSRLVGSTSNPSARRCKPHSLRAADPYAGKRGINMLWLFLTSQWLSRKRGFDGARQGRSDMRWFPTSTYYAIVSGVVCARCRGGRPNLFRPILILPPTCL